MYYESFMSSAEYANKVKQKSFGKLSDDDRNAWIDQRFFVYVSRIEREKVLYFALTYQQTTLIISAPDDIKAQEKFLGYKR